MGKKYLTLGFDGSPEKDDRLIHLMSSYGLRGTFYLNPRQLQCRDLTEIYGDTEIASCASYIEQGKVLSERHTQRVMDRNIEKLRSLTGRTVSGYAYATGQPSKQMQEHLKEKGILYARGILNGKGFSFPENIMHI